MDMNDLARRLIAPLKPYFLSFDGTRDLGRGTAFPLSADLPGGLQTSDRFFRTDLGWLCYYDGTRWLTVHTYLCTLTHPNNNTVSFSAGQAAIRLGMVYPDYAPYYVRANTIIQIGATNNGTNYSVYQVKDSYGTTIWQYDTSTDAANTFPYKNSTGFTQPAAIGTRYLQLDITTVGLPAAQAPYQVALWYRLIIT